MPVLANRASTCDTPPPMPATQSFIAYRDRIGVPSEIGFLRRQYIGFTHLHPVWTGRVLLPAAPDVGKELFRIGGDGPLGPLHRILFHHFGHVPPLPPCAAILHAQFARGGALALPIAQRFGLRLIVTLHGGDVAKRKNWRAGTVLARRWPALLRETAHFVCVSAAVAEIAAAKGVPPHKVTVLPIGVEIPDQPPRRDPTAHLFVGRFVEKKGIRVLIGAMRQLRARGDQTPLVCVGDGPLRPLMESLARELPGITLTGWLRPADVQDRMRQAFSLVVPSIIAADGDAEGLPSVIPEAMAQACPVIGSDQGGIAEAICHNRTGLLVAPGDADALADAMHHIMHDSLLGPSGLGLAGYTYSATELNAHTQSRRLEAILSCI
jgi:colanic acid/amylovoran biosynthesis glycosyltransferase